MIQMPFLHWQFLTSDYKWKQSHITPVYLCSVLLITERKIWQTFLDNLLSCPKAVSDREATSINLHILKNCDFIGPKYLLIIIIQNLLNLLNLPPALSFLYVGGYLMSFSLDSS